MGPNRKTQLAVFCVAAWLAWTAFARAAHETVTLHISDVRHEDHFARVWVVEDPPFFWIRAERPDRHWLRPLRERRRLTLTRDRNRSEYEAQVWDSPEARRDVDALFREKYGLADLIRGLLVDREPIPIRLTRL